jgi:serine/threonine protein kinase
MSAEVVEHWLKSGRNAIVCKTSLKPIEHNLLKGKPLSSQKGQAEAFFLIDDNGNWWVLKKFHSNSTLEHKYLSRVGALLPKEDGFKCGTKRQVLSRGALWKTRGYHYNKDLDKWLDGTILMPRIVGFDWGCLADEIRDASVSINELQRFTICRNLTHLIELLEANQGCHRDLSCGNVFIDTDTWQVYLIDFDSLFHPSLTMPRATTCGTKGYIAHHAWNNGSLDPRRTWCQHADRYALTLLNTEFLLVNPGVRATAEGGIFNQEELKNQAGSGINSVITELKSKFPSSAQLLESAIHSSSFSDCPSPHDWMNSFNTIPGLTATPPSLVDFQDIQPGNLAGILKKCRPATQLWPAPNLNELSDIKIQLPEVPKINIPKVMLPPDPWQNKN